MPFEFAWLLPDRIIYTCETGILTEGEIVSFDQALCCYLDAASAPTVHLVIDVEEVSILPSVASMVRRFTFPDHPKLGWSVAVTDDMNEIARKIVAVAQERTGQGLCEVDSIEEALATLRRVDPSLAELP
jgi:hypothetical protein